MGWRQRGVCGGRHVMAVNKAKKKKSLYLTFSFDTKKTNWETLYQDEFERDYVFTYIGEIHAKSVGEIHAESIRI